MTTKQPLKLGNLKLEPICPAELAQMRNVLENTTLPKIIEDQRRHVRNVARVRDLVAYDGPRPR